ncbi:MAG: hypothetical protein QM500_02545 [Methylococcales bacterium]
MIIKYCVPRIPIKYCVPRILPRIQLMLVAMIIMWLSVSQRVEFLGEFPMTHTPSGFQGFFDRIEQQNHSHGDLPVDVAMEGYNGWARPLDHLVQTHCY